MEKHEVTLHVTIKNMNITTEMNTKELDKPTRNEL